MVEQEEVKEREGEKLAQTGGGGSSGLPAALRLGQDKCMVRAIGPRGILPCFQLLYLARRRRWLLLLLQRLRQARRQPSIAQRWRTFSN